MQRIQQSQIHWVSSQILVPGNLDSVCGIIIVEVVEDGPRIGFQPRQTSLSCLQIARAIVWHIEKVIFDRNFSVGFICVQNPYSDRVPNLVSLLDRLSRDEVVSND